MITTNLIESAGPVIHRIALTVTDPNHPMVSKRGETLQRTVRVPGADREKAINAAIAHYRRRGYRVHDHHYIGTVDPIDEGKPQEKEADYGADYQAMVQRVKKLAGIGPMKTVHDPAKRVYRNVPTAVQPKRS